MEKEIDYGTMYFVCGGDLAALLFWGYLGMKMSYFDEEIPVAVGVIIIDERWKVERVNDEFARVFGYEKEELEGMYTDELVASMDRYLLEETFEQVIRGKAIASQEVRIIRKDKKVCWVRMRCKLKGYVNVHPQLSIVLWDIDEEKISLMEQDLLKQRYRAMELLSQEYPLDLDIANNMILCSSRYLRHRGEMDAIERYVPFQKLMDDVYPDDRLLLAKRVEEASKSEKTGRFDVRINLSAEPEIVQYTRFRVYYQSVVNEEGKVVRILGRMFDLDRDKVVLEDGKRDTLTKLVHKSELQARIGKALEERLNGTHAMFLIDIDGFKGVNENFGHVFGDSVLVEVANTIKAVFEENELVGRLGGDEFLVMMPDATLEQAKEQAQKLCKALTKRYTGKQIEYTITASVGVAMYPVDGRSYAELLEKVDHAKHRAKKAGKNTYELANASDSGKIVLEPKRVDEHIRISLKNRGFIADIVDLMGQGKNPEASMNRVLEQIATRFDLDYVAIFEDNKEKQIAHMTNYYHSYQTFPEHMTIKMTDDKIANLQIGDFLAVNTKMLSPLEFDGKLQSQYESIGKLRDSSTIICRFGYAQDQIGTVFFVDENKDREFTPEEIHFFKELTHTISLFITLRFRLHESRDKVRHLQRRDMLTNLYNQDAFRQVVPRRFNERGTDEIYALEYFDINNFGYVNENYGYKVGDDILKLLALDLKKQPYYVAGCRLYSDFFLVLVKDTSVESLVSHIKERSRLFSEMQNKQYPNSSMGVTAGLYVFESDNCDIDVAIENASLAWKMAKKAGKGEVKIYDDQMRSNRAQEKQVIGDFFEALQANDFHMYLQPKFLLGSRQIYGAEALSRWRRADGQVLPPIAFIESLEKIGYIKELDFYIFEEVLKTLEKWRKKNLRPIIISTNFSGRHFEGNVDEFIQRIATTLAKYEVSPENIELEVTESVCVENFEGLLYSLKELHAMGFRVAIDDFGTGYSSLSMLADMPADVVKIDKSFINKNMTDQKQKLLYEIGNMVRILNKDIVVEGIETEEQEHYLKDGGFSCGQGYLCNKPIPLEEFEELYL